MANPTVLIADDAALVRFQLNGVFQELDFNVVAQAKNGEEAVQLFKEHNPDLVTLDIVMPVKTGIEALNEIKDIDPNARIIMISSMGQKEMMDQARESGVVDFLIKPFVLSKDKPFLMELRKAILKEKQDSPA